MNQATTAATLLAALPRFGLAMIIGLVLRPFLLLVIFQEEDRLQVVSDKNEQRTAGREAIERQEASAPHTQDSDRDA